MITWWKINKGGKIMKDRSRNYIIAAIGATLLFATAAFAQQGRMHGMQGDYGMQQGSDYRHDGMYRRKAEPVDQKQAEIILKDYVLSTDNPNLKPGKINEKKNVFEAEIITKDGSLVDKIWIEKDTGWVNTRYGADSGARRRGRGMGYGMRGDWNFCPYCGSDIRPGRYRHMGPGMMGHGYGMGRGMHHGMGYGYGGDTPYRRRDKPVDKTEAKQRMENYLEFIGNPNLKVGEIKETDTEFEAEIVTKKQKDLVNKIVIDKQTGRMRSYY
jgi:hypothetical protein